jgi:hypothetical protein
LGQRGGQQGRLVGVSLSSAKVLVCWPHVAVSTTAHSRIRSMIRILELVFIGCSQSGRRAGQAAALIRLIRQKMTMNRRPIMW